MYRLINLLNKLNISLGGAITNILSKGKKNLIIGCYQASKLFFKLSKLPFKLVQKIFTTLTKLPSSDWLGLKSVLNYLLKLSKFIIEDPLFRLPILALSGLGAYSLLGSVIMMSVRTSALCLKLSFVLRGIGNQLYYANCSAAEKNLIDNCLTNRKLLVNNLVEEELGFNPKALDKTIISKIGFNPVKIPYIMLKAIGSTALNWPLKVWDYFSFNQIDTQFVSQIVDNIPMLLDAQSANDATYNTGDASIDNLQTLLSTKNDLFPTIISATSGLLTQFETTIGEVSANDAIIEPDLPSTSLRFTVL